MTTSFEQFCRPFFGQMIAAYRGGVFNAHLELFDGDIETIEQDAKKCNDNLKELFRVDSPKIIKASASQIQKYLNTFGVVAGPYDIDEFKLIYFVGRVIAAQLKSRGHSETRKVVLFQMVILMDICLKDVTNGVGRPDLLKRLKRLILSGDLEDNFGTHGTYITYKIASNMLKDASKCS